MIFFDALMRFTGVGLLMMLAVLTIRDIRSSQSARYLLLSCISVASLLLGLTPEYLQLPTALKTVVRFLDVPHLIFIWLFALSLFQANFKLRAFHLIVAVIYCTPIFLVRLSQFEVINEFSSWWYIMASLLSVALMTHLMVTTLSGRADDLVQKRRASRYYFVIIIAFVAITTAIVEGLLVGDKREYLYTAKVLTIWPGIIWVCYWLFDISPNTITFGVEANPVAKLQAKDKSVVKRLETEMLESKPYLNHSLSIADLAKILSVTPHRLRALINQNLGYENFSSYVNSFRIEAIKQAFDDPNNDHLPILTIALEFGFNSLSPFNRAFKSSEGVPPSEYRKKLSIKSRKTA